MYPVPLKCCTARRVAPNLPRVARVRLSRWTRFVIRPYHTAGIDLDRRMNVLGCGSRNIVGTFTVAASDAAAIRPLMYRAAGFVRTTTNNGSVCFFYVRSRFSLLDHD